MGDFKKPGFFFFIKNILFILLNNTAINLKLLNNKLNIIKSIIIDPKNKYLIYLSKF